MPGQSDPTNGKWWKRIRTRLTTQSTTVDRGTESDKRRESASQQDKIPQPATAPATTKIIPSDPPIDRETSASLPAHSTQNTAQSTQNIVYSKRVDSLRNRRARIPAATPDVGNTSTPVRDQSGLYAALANAAHEGDEELVRRLSVDAGAQVLPGRSEPITNFGSFRYTIQPSPLHEAISMGHTNIASFLLDRFALGGGQNSGPASEFEKKELAEMRDAKGRTLLSTACVAGDAETVKKLLDLGAKTETRDRNGLTALHLAARSPTPSHSIVKLLIDYGADKNAKDDSWITLLQDAENNLLPEEIAILFRPAPSSPRPKQRRKKPRVPLPKTSMDHRLVISNDGNQDRKDTLWPDGVLIRNSEREV
ncbi:unnamed protein product [Clonostachys rosea]|uniref:Uncharacterized protein n=1 Tax=Bionectria ochroleuca TaxID=29856 RepID=A0ABY6UE13_BIOOC|nr:unnamed protein product [Clonostachys rosea]